MVEYILKRCISHTLYYVKIRSQCGLSNQLRVSHPRTYSLLDRKKSTLIFPQQLTYSFHRNKIAHHYLNASRTRSFTFPTIILYFEFRILRYCPRDFGLDCSRYKRKTHALQFKSFTLLIHNPSLTTKITLPTFTVVQFQDSHTHPTTEL